MSMGGEGGGSGARNQAGEGTSFGQSDWEKLPSVLRDDAASPGQIDKASLREQCDDYDSQSEKADALSQARVRRYVQRTDHLRDEHSARMIFSYCFVGIMVLWLLVVTIVVIWSGLEGTIFISNGQSLSLPLGIPNLDVPETVQLKLVDGATYQVIGLVAVSAMYLFGVRRKKIDDPGA